MTVVMARMPLPPGFRFHPTDEELIMYYLKRKITGKKLFFDAVTELNVYKFSPWDLPGIIHLYDNSSCLRLCFISIIYISLSAYHQPLEFTLLLESYIENLYGSLPLHIHPCILLSISYLLWFIFCFLLARCVLEHHCLVILYNFLQYMYP